MRIFILFVALALTGCRMDDGGSKEEITRLQQAVEKLQSSGQEIEKLKELNTALTAQVKTLENKVGFDELLYQFSREGSASYISLTDKSFSVVNTSLGKFLVSVEDVVPFANGTKLILSIGNPQAMTYSGLKLSFSWTKPSAKDAETQKKELDIPNIIIPGSWNKVEVVLSPAKADDIDNVSLAITPNVVRLQKTR
jgi:hypothetical protein